MKIKIIEPRRFFISILVITILISICFLLFSSRTYSHGEISYYNKYINIGDTLWNIAKEEQKNNMYYQSKNIEFIIEDIKLKNNLENSYLKEGQILKIPQI